MNDYVQLGVSILSAVGLFGFMLKLNGRMSEFETSIKIFQALVDEYRKEGKERNESVEPKIERIREDFTKIHYDATRSQEISKRSHERIDNAFDRLEALERLCKEYGEQMKDQQLNALKLQMVIENLAGRVGNK